MCYPSTRVKCRTHNDNNLYTNSPISNAVEWIDELSISFQNHIAVSSSAKLEIHIFDLVSSDPKDGYMVLNVDAEPYGVINAVDRMRKEDGKQERDTENREARMMFRLKPFHNLHD